MKLSNDNLHKFTKNIKRPSYDRSSITPGIVHIGLGNFHRAHQSWYLHRLMEQGMAMDWGIIGAGVRPADNLQRDRLAQQDFLTTLIELDPKAISAEIVGSMIGFVPVEEDNAALIAQMADPAIRIVSLTVTEGGYYIDPISKTFDEQHPDIQHDAKNPEKPRTAFGAMIAALKIRRKKGMTAFTAQSCDNLQGNGAILRETIVSLAARSDADLANWIDQNCSFPNSMVDCIVPATSDKELELAKTFGIDDAAPVTHENFRQWVIEDNFCAGRPNWEKVGVTFTNDVHDFEAMKIRILNGGHQLISNVGEILSIETISGCMEETLISEYFKETANTEIAKQVKPLPEMVLQEYVDLIVERFSNPKIFDTVRRVAFDGSSRHTGFLLPTLMDALEKNQPMDGLALSQAIWARMCEGTREDGTKIEPNDPIWDKLNDTAIAAKLDPSVWLKQSTLYGDLSQNVTFQKKFEYWFNLIWSRGVLETLKIYIGK
jgi:mannitol 2-dehydrogenase